MSTSIETKNLKKVYGLYIMSAIYFIDTTTKYLRIVL